MSNRSFFALFAKEQMSDRSFFALFKRTTKRPIALSLFQKERQKSDRSFKKSDKKGDRSFPLSKRAKEQKLAKNERFSKSLIFRSKKRPITYF